MCNDNVGTSIALARLRTELCERNALSSVRDDLSRPDLGLSIVGPVYPNLLTHLLMRDTLGTRLMLRKS